MSITRTRLAFRDFMHSSRREEQYLFLQRYIGYFDEKIALVLDVGNEVLREVEETFLQRGCVNELNVEDAQRRLFSSYDFEKLFQAVYSQVASEVFPTFLRTPKLKQAAGDLEAILRAHGLEEFMSKFRKRGVTDIRQLQQEDYTDSQLYRNKYKIDKIGIQKRLCRIVNKELHLLAILLSEES